MTALRIRLRQGLMSHYFITLVGSVAALSVDVAIAGGVGGATIFALYYVPSAYILAMCRGRCEEAAVVERSADSFSSPKAILQSPALVSV